MKNRYRPYGYGMVQGKIVIISSEAEMIRRIFKEYISWRISENNCGNPYGRKDPIPPR